MNNFDEPKKFGIFDRTEGRELASRIENSGSAVVLFPACECKAAVLDNSEIEILRNIKNFTWIILSDVFAAHYFLDALNSAGVDFVGLDAARVCCVGEPVAHYLRIFSIHTDLVVEPSIRYLQSSLIEFAGDEVEGSKFLVPIGSTSLKPRCLELIARGAIFSEIALFERRSPARERAPAAKSLLLGGGIDEIIFLHYSDIFSLIELFPGVSLNELLAEVRVVAANEEIFKSLADFGLNAHYQAK